MKNTLISLLASICLTTAAFVQEVESVAPPTLQNNTVADMVIWGGPIYTADDDNPMAEAVAIKGGRFVYVGNKADANALTGTQTMVIDLAGSTLFPGFVDAHAHLNGIGAREMMLNLEGVASISGVQDQLTAWITSHPESQIIIGRGWIETHWPKKRFPTRWDLDAVTKDIPIILERADGHAIVANSAALAAAGITGDTVPPFGGDILKNALGEPTGMIIDAAMGLIFPIIPASTEEQEKQAFKVGGDIYAAYGWTGLHNMGASWGGLDMMESLSDSGAMGIRVYNSVDFTESETLLSNGPRASKNGRVITRAIKMYVDGALGSRGAALLAPYSDADTHGLIQAKDGDVLPIMRLALRRGIQVNTHAIGDAGNRQVLDWYEKIFKESGLEDESITAPRWRIEHAQIINSADIPRFKSLGVIPSMQPSHAIGDMYFAPDRLGEERLYGAYAWRTLIDSGVIVPGGSDAPVERGDPLIESLVLQPAPALNLALNYKPINQVILRLQIVFFSLNSDYGFINTNILLTY